MPQRAKGTITEYLEALTEFAEQGGPDQLRRVSMLEGRLASDGVSTSEMMSQLLYSHQTASQSAVPHECGALTPLAASAVLREINQTLRQDGRPFARIEDDGAAQLLAVASLRLDAAAGKLPPQCGRCFGEVRNFLLENIQVQLPPIPLTRPGLLGAIQELAARILHGTNLQFTLSGDAGAVPEVLQTAVLRILEEVLTNIVRHAGARSVHVLVQEADWLAVTVRDDGSGFDPEAVFSGRAGMGIGLLGIRERVRLLGGRFSVLSEPGQGARISIRLRANRPSL
jgi:signal transduction histidine kinase